MCSQSTGKNNLDNTPAIEDKLYSVMRIVFACPPITDFYATPPRLAALGPELFVKKLVEKGHQVRLFNFAATCGGSRSIPLPQELSHLKPFLVENETGPVSFFPRYRHFGPDYIRCAELIEQENPA